MIARLSALDATFAPRGPQEGIMGKHCGSLSTRKLTEPRLCCQLQDQRRVEPLFNAKGEGTVSAPDGRARRRIPWNQLSWNDDLVGGFLV